VLIFPNLGELIVPIKSLMPSRVQPRIWGSNRPPARMYVDLTVIFCSSSQLSVAVVPRMVMGYSTTAASILQVSMCSNTRVIDCRRL
jgi:hypothetical protein